MRLIVVQPVRRANESPNCRCLAAQFAHVSQAAAVRMFLRFFLLSVFAFQVGER
jgi:hypothetical protein